MVLAIVPVAAAIDGLLTLMGAPPDANGVRVGTALGLEDALVIDGPPLDDVDVGDAVAVGLSIADVQATAGVVVHARASAQVGFDVTCLAQSWSGEVDIAPGRVRCFEMFAGVEALLPLLVRAVPALIDARVSRWSYRPLLGPSAGALVEFTIRFDAGND